MDRPFAETEVLTEKEVETEKNVDLDAQEEIQLEKSEEQEKKTEEIAQEKTSQNSYINSFENLTVADIMREEEKKKEEEFKAEKEKLIEKQYESQQPEEKKEEKPEQKIKDETKEESQSTTSATIIEKPNYDLLEENTKIIKLKKHASTKRPKKKNLAGLALACALGGAAIICVTNCVIIDNMNSGYFQIEDTYNLNLQKYLKDIYNLDATKNSMEMLETYPDELLDAGDVGKKSNWFDRLCGFLGGLFGG